MYSQSIVMIVNDTLKDLQCDKNISLIDQYNNVTKEEICGYGNHSNANLMHILNGNGSQADAKTVPFFEHYFAKERFIAECVLASAAVLINTVAFFSSKLQHHQHYAYYALFKNLTFANAMFCIFSWLSNNILIIFSDHLSMDYLCMLLSLMTMALIANTLFGFISILMLLGFSLVHYVAVCHPLAYPVRINKTLVDRILLIIWGAILIIASIPITIIIAKVLVNCTQDKFHFIEHVTRACINVSIGLLQFTILLIFAFCIRIQVEIKSLQSRLSDYCWMDEMELEKRTFRSILLLVFTLTLFYFPFTIVFVISHNQSNVDMLNIKAVIFYMTLMPYLKFITDPILYKKTIIDFRASLRLCRNMCVCMCCCCRTDKNSRRSSILTTRLTRLSSNPRRDMRVGKVITIL